ncbi:hypothetical protein ES703_60310 [subsurface metagenome]
MPRRLPGLSQGDAAGLSKGLLSGAQGYVAAKTQGECPAVLGQEDAIAKTETACAGT